MTNPEAGADLSFHLPDWVVLWSIDRRKAKRETRNRSTIDEDIDEDL
ncbi:MAG: hypothetical protein HC895_04650 [Leptolyngbyaceae cyanobacterium SM1_3_5]|nr:hypothetical protein [Leptolyngbyaceae cyanobacterium SM1_3_5]